jgi:hypothetical protein
MAPMMRIPNLANLNPALATGFLAVAASFLALPAVAQNAPAQPAAAVAAQAPSYTDLVDLTQSAELVLRVIIKNQRNVPLDRAPGLAPGHARLYLQAETQALLAGAGPAAARYAFLTDVPLDARGRRPDLKDGVYLLFARRVPGQPGDLQLVGRGAMQVFDAGLEQRVRTVLTQLVQGERPPQITGVREAISVPGNLAGESETQIFLRTEAGVPVSLSIIRRPGMAPSWGVSWSEIVDQSARPPAPETLQWQMLACNLPEQLPDAAFLQRDVPSRTRAREDYAFVRRALGNCGRTL